MKTRFLFPLLSLTVFFTAAPLGYLAFASDAFEPDDNAGQASAIWSGPPQTHSIFPIADEDWATFLLPTSCGVVIETSGFSRETRRRAALRQPSQALGRLDSYWKVLRCSPKCRQAVRSLHCPCFTRLSAICRL